MKLKQDPDDFRVEELTGIQPGSDGPFALYRLEKRNWTTHDAISAIRRSWQLHAQRVAYGGLKDRHAATVQYLSIFRGPHRNFQQPGFQLTWLGQIREPYSSRAVDANRFEITLRDLDADRASAACERAPVLSRDGAPNYFDDQRFGSVGADRDFIARRMVRGEFETALKLALAAPYEFDRAAAKKEKAILLENWGRWAECKDLLPCGHARSLIDYLKHHPTDFRGAVGRLRPDLQGLYLSAYQSFLWNAILGGWLSERMLADNLISLNLRLGSFPAPRSFDDASREHWRGAVLPLPAARWRFDPSAEWSSIAERVLADEGFTWEQLKIRGLQKPFFTKGERAAWSFPADFAAERFPDERNAGRFALRLKFSLPRGSYATIIVKRLMAGLQ